LNDRREKHVVMSTVALAVWGPEGSKGWVELQVMKAREKSEDSDEESEDEQTQFFLNVVETEVVVQQLKRRKKMSILVPFIQVGHWQAGV
jgi:hypothetical protein